LAPGLASCDRAGRAFPRRCSDAPQIPQGLAVHAAGLGRRLTIRPSRIIAIASIRRAAEPVLLAPAAIRSSAAVTSSRVIETAAPIDAAPLRSRHRVRLSLIWESQMSQQLGPLVSDRRPARDLMCRSTSRTRLRSPRLPRQERVEPKQMVGMLRTVREVDWCRINAGRDLFLDEIGLTYDNSITSATANPSTKPIFSVIICVHVKQCEIAVYARQRGNEPALKAGSPRPSRAMDFKYDLAKMPQRLA